MPVLRNTVKKSSQRPRRRRSVREARRRAALRRRNAVIGIIAAIMLIGVALFLLPAGGHEADSTSEEIEAAGTEAGHAVASTPPNSMERERVVLEIRSRESQLRNAGFPSAADSYAGAAEKAMKDAGVLE